MPPSLTEEVRAVGLPSPELADTLRLLCRVRDCGWSGASLSLGPSRMPAELPRARRGVLGAGTAAERAVGEPVLE